MMRVLSLTRCVVWAGWLAAARAPFHVSHESQEKHPPLKSSAERPYVALPTEPPEDTIEMMNQSGATERTSLQDRPGLDPYHPDLERVTLLKITRSDSAREHEKTPNKWFGKSTRCTANAEGTAAAEGGQASGDGPAGGADAGNGTSTTPKQLKNSHAPYKGAVTGPPEDHFLDDA